MRKEKRIFYLLVGGCIMIFSFSFKPVSSIEKNASTKTADTTLFTHNVNGGWNTLSVYLNQDTPDSVGFELILTQPISLNWNAEQFIGTISNENFHPNKNQTIGYALFMNNNWNIRIEKTGKCFLKQVNGQAIGVSSLLGSPFVLLVKVRYKNN